MDVRKLTWLEKVGVARPGRGKQLNNSPILARPVDPSKIAGVQKQRLALHHGSDDVPVFISHRRNLLQKDPVENALLCAMLVDSLVLLLD